MTKAQKRLNRWFAKNTPQEIKAQKFSCLLSLAASHARLYDRLPLPQRVTVEDYNPQRTNFYTRQLFVFREDNGLPQFKAGVIYFPKEWLQEYSREDLLSSLYGVLYDVHGLNNPKTRYLSPLAYSFKRHSFVFPLGAVLLFKEQLMKLFEQELKQTLLGINSVWFKQPVPTKDALTFEQFCWLWSNGHLHTEKVINSYLRAYYHA